jgi:hypothetical protein
MCVSFDIMTMTNSCFATRTTLISSNTIYYKYPPNMFRLLSGMKGNISVQVIKILHKIYSSFPIQGLSH